MYNKYRNANGEVAQLARASGSYPAGREFESPLRYQDIKKQDISIELKYLFLISWNFLNLVLNIYILFLIIVYI